MLDIYNIIRKRKHGRKIKEGIIYFYCELFNFNGLISWPFLLK